MCCQVAAVLTTTVLGSATLFAWHCANSQIWLASLHPPLMYGLLILLFLPLPPKILFQVSSCHGNCPWLLQMSQQIFFPGVPLP